MGVDTSEMLRSHEISLFEPVNRRRRTINVPEE